jgi:hypothetical protein
MWVDNFCKFFGVRTPSLDKGIYLNCAWTGMALTKHLGDPEAIDLTVSDRQHGMPDDLWACYDMFLAQMEAIADDVTVGAKESFVERYDVRRIPLKVGPKNLPEGVLPDRLKFRSSESLHNFYPVKLIDENIGSNKGFFRIMWKILQDAKADPRQRIQLLNTDSNIYSRIMKVTYNQTCSTPVLCLDA